LITFFDSKGRKLTINKEEYRKKVLPDHFKKVQNDPDQLYTSIVLSLQDGFFEDCISPAQQLYKIDIDRERSTAILAITYLKCNKLDEAQDLLEKYLKDVGKSGVILTNLAKIAAERGDDSMAEDILWDALVADPNQDNALKWWMAIHFERGGEAARIESIQKVANLPGSWLAQLWLAQEALGRHRLDIALGLYNSVMTYAGENGLALRMISGDLGRNGYYQEALELVTPVYDPEKHGPDAGLNLVQACIELQDIKRGKKIFKTIEHLNRPDIKAHLENLRKRLKCY
jgi:tetratricopeptide (TPR) repeat protein